MITALKKLYEHHHADDLMVLKKLYERHAQDCTRAADLRSIPGGASNISSWRASGLKRPRRSKYRRN
jgi:hypothetical protein